MQAWLIAFRLRTLPLSLSCIVIGSAMSYRLGSFDYLTFILLISTTIFLQILSTLANDYGDSEHGADNDERVGPERTVQSGAISSLSMKKAMFVFAVLSLISGLALLFLAFGYNRWPYILGFLVLGILAIWSAVSYTAGSKPYGYIGLGDLFVFIFFGLVGVLGALFLIAKSVHLVHLLPACSIGFLSTSVLNLNNMRDHVGDANAGKRTLVVRIGLNAARWYHTVLIISAFVFVLVFIQFEGYSHLSYLFLISAPLFMYNLKQVWGPYDPKLLDGQLKLLAMSSFIFSLLFSLSLVLI